MNKTRYLRLETQKLIATLNGTEVYEKMMRGETVRIEDRGKIYIIFTIADGTLAENIYYELSNGGLRDVYPF